MMRIYGRQCEVIKITPKEANDFIDKYHEQGSRTSKINYGLFYNNELVQVATFDKPLIEQQNKSFQCQWELIRECSKKDVWVIGGKSKLLTAFEQEHKPISLLSYCNGSRFSGDSYIKCGFKLESSTQGYHYETEDGKIITRYNMQKSRTKRLQGKKENIETTLTKLGYKYDPNLTELQNATNARLTKVMDNKQLKFCKYYTNNYGYIYLITNKVNGKTYIGQHTVMRDGKLKKIQYNGSGVALQEAYNKYGYSSFTMEVLEWVSDLDTLADREYYYINKYKEMGKAEYNMSVSPYAACANRKQHPVGNNSQAMKKWWSEHHDEMVAIIKDRAEQVSDSLKVYYSTHDNANKGKKWDDEFKHKVSEGVKRAWKNGTVKAHSIPQEQRNRQSETLKRKFANMTPEERKAMCGHKPLTPEQQTVSQAALRNKMKQVTEEINSMGYKTRKQLIEEGIPIKTISNDYYVVFKIGQCGAYKHK